MYCFFHSDITKFYFVLLGQGFGQQLLHQYVIYVIQIQNHKYESNDINDIYYALMKYLLVKNFPKEKEYML